MTWLKSVLKNTLSKCCAFKKKAGSAGLRIEHSPNKQNPKFVLPAHPEKKGFLMIRPKEFDLAKEQSCQEFNPLTYCFPKMVFSHSNLSCPIFLIKNSHFFKLKYLKTKKPRLLEAALAKDE